MKDAYVSQPDPKNRENGIESVVQARNEVTAQVPPERSGYAESADQLDPPMRQFRAFR
jgi:hypothetical protein